jgi:16S rRNA C1402 (ribose-2'-O) methylase RsmI
MLTSLDALEREFQGIVIETKSKCGDVLEKMRQAALIQRYIVEGIEEYTKSKEDFISKFMSSIVQTCYYDLVRISGHILFLSCNGLYRNAFDNIRYMLESIVQAVYIDNRHPEAPIETKIEILKEVEGKKEYGASRLIEELSIDHKDRLKKEYKDLSKIIHPSHTRVIATLTDIGSETGVRVKVNCEEILRIHEATLRMYDIFFFLFMECFPEVKETLKKNPNIIKSLETYHLPLVSSVLEVESSH